MNEMSKYFKREKAYCFPHSNCRMSTVLAFTVLLIES